MDVGVVRWRVLLPQDDLGKQQSLEGRIVQILWERPAKALPHRSLHVIAHRTLGKAGRRGDPLVTQSRLELETQNFSDFAHGTPFGWQRLLSRSKNRGA